MNGHDDILHMRHALRLAARALGQVAPNPAVGCVLVKDGRVVGRGWTQRGGRPHAETVAIAAAGAEAKGATAYVTLEPCAHHGKSPPCADALIAAGIARVVGACADPDPRVNGQGFAMLERAGVAVTKGVCKDEALTLNAGFIKRVTEGRPLVALKIAQSADGFVADASGKSKWITGERARAHGHLLRARHDAIMVGIGTVLADDPLLTCRLPGLEDRSPVRVVLDSHLRLPPDSQLAGTAQAHPTIVFTSTSGGERLEELGLTIERVEAKNGRPELAAVLSALAKRGITRLLVEGGPTVHANLMEAGLVDRVHVYTAPLLLKRGLKAAQGKIDIAQLKLLSRQAFGPDVLESFAVTV